MNTIRFYIKHVYGNPIAYPVDFKDAITALTNRKTLTYRDFGALKALGFEFVEIKESDVI